MMKTSGYILALTIMVAGAVHAADTEIFRWVDRDGTVHYSDRPETPDAKVVGHSRQTDPATIREQQLRNWEEQKNAQEARDQEQAVAAYDAERDAENERVREIRCQRAREMAEVYSTAHQLYETLPNGERRYLTDDELTEARESAAKNISESCN
jgi:hypothetical protein